MSMYVLMRILESVPSRYEFGISILTLGHLDKAYNHLADRIEPGQRVLDLGCGTGALTLRAARRGARVKGIDVDARMLEVARQRVKIARLTESVGEDANHYDAVMSGLCLSELSEEELTYTLKETARILRPGGLMLIAEEIRPKSIFKRFVHMMLRIPLAVLAYAVTQQTTRAVSNLPEKLIDAGFSIMSLRLNLLGSFGEIIAQKLAAKSS
jgi:ubiquinone/menaquinone biosynthesis C-methylase UbiE